MTKASPSIFLSLMFFWCFVGKGATQTNEDTVLTFNVLCKSCARDAATLESWERRRNPIFRLIGAQAPDLMAIQELEGSMLQDFEEHFGSSFFSYAGTLYDESLGVGPGHRNVIMYRKSRYRFVQGGSFRLGFSRQADVRKIEDAYLRNCTWAILEKRSRNKLRFRLLSCHLPFSNPSQTKIAVQKLSQFLWSGASQELPLIVAGDFNALANSRSISYLLGSKGQFSGYDYAPNWNSLINQGVNTGIDFVFHQGDYQVSGSTSVGNTPYEGSYEYSDHPAIVLRGNFVDKLANASPLAAIINLIFAE